MGHRQLVFPVGSGKLSVGSRGGVSYFLRTSAVTSTKVFVACTIKLVGNSSASSVQAIPNSENLFFRKEEKRCVRKLL
jgi:hypothetical protein